MRRNRGLIITTLVVVVVIIGAVVVSRLIPKQDRGSFSVNASPSTSQSSGGTPSGVPSDGGAQKDGSNDDDIESTYTPAPSCEASLDAATYAMFISKVKAYQGSFLSPPSHTRAQAMTELTTQQYQLDHDSTAAQSQTSDVTVRLLDTSLITCVPESDGSRQVSVLATIETSHQDDTGVKVVIVPELRLPTIYYSTWVEDGGTWKVNEEH